MKIVAAAVIIVVRVVVIVTIKPNLQEYIRISNILIS